MKTVHVAAAVIVRNGKILVTKRGYGAFKDFWEFPGGKIEDGESPENAVVRVAAEKSLGIVEYDYPDFHLIMECFLCSIVSGEITLLEHKDAKWLLQSELSTLTFLPADVYVLKLIADVL